MLEITYFEVLSVLFPITKFSNAGVCSWCSFLVGFFFKKKIYIFFRAYKITIGPYNQINEINI